MTNARTRVALTIVLGILGALSFGSAGQAAEDVPASLRRQTQELFDAVTAGDSTIWDRYLATPAT